jgi:predicted cobalt transporter CbtA
MQAQDTALLLQPSTRQNSVSAAQHNTKHAPALDPAVTGQVDGMQEAWAPAQVQQALQSSLLQLRAGRVLACLTEHDSSNSNSRSSDSR